MRRRRVMRILNLKGAEMARREVHLSDNDAEFVDDSVASGRFESPSEVVHEALGLLKLHQENEALRLAALKAAIEVGLEDERQGRLVSIDPGEELSFLRSLGRTDSRES